MSWNDITPCSWDKHIIVQSGAIVGGIAFGITLSWTAAVIADLYCIFCVWAVIRLMRIFMGTPCPPAASN